MSDDPWKDYATGAAVTPADETATDPWSTYTSPGLTTPRAPTEMRASPEDKYRAAAIADVTRTNKAGYEPGYTERVGKGAGFGWTDELMAAGRTPIEMFRHGTIDPREGYRYAKAQQDILDQQMEKNTAGLGGALAEVAGGAATGAGVLGAGLRAGAKTLPAWMPGVGGRTIPATAVNWTANVGKGGGLGAFAGAGGAPNIEGIPEGMMTGGVLGGILGGAAPVAVSTLQHGARILQAPRLRDPQNIAVEQIAEVARAAGVAPAEIAQRVADANAAGQPYTVADALGHEGARKLAAMAKVPGPQREAIVTALTERNLNMPVRTGEQVGQAMGAPNTARQAQETLYEKAQQASAPHYAAAEAHPTWSSRLQEEFLDHPLAQQGLKKGVWIQSIENAGNAKKPLQDAMITGFDEAGNTIWSGVPNLRSIDTLKKGLDRMIEEQTNPLGHVTAEGRAIIGFKNRLLDEVDALNPAYKEARAQFADPMQIRSAVERGQEMKSTGRAADNLQEFRDMRPGEQQGARIGYADAVQKQLEQTGNFPALLREKSVKGARELEGMNLYQGPRQPGAPDPLRQYLNREEEMLKTSHKAIGGSSTAENVADMAAGPGGAEVLGILGNVATGNLPGAGRGAMSALDAIRRGESTAQRVAITKALLARDEPTIAKLAQELEQHELRRRGVNPWTGTYRIRPGE